VEWTAQPLLLPEAGRREREHHYQTAFNLSYGPEAERTRSLAWGAAFGLAGMLAASPLLRRRKNAEAAHG
jgi:hypothetical protein